MGSLVNFINNFKKDIKSIDNNDGCKKFFFSSILHLSVSLEIASSSILEENINLSKLNLLVPCSLGNEENIKEVLKEGIKKNFLLKKNL